MIDGRFRSGGCGGVKVLGEVVWKFFGSVEEVLATCKDRSSAEEVKHWFMVFSFPRGKGQTRAR